MEKRAYNADPDVTFYTYIIWFHTEKTSGLIWTLAFEHSGVCVRFFFLKNWRKRKVNFEE